MRTRIVAHDVANDGFSFGSVNASLVFLRFE
jgi:hypothetical protein